MSDEPVYTHVATEETLRKILTLVEADVGHSASTVDDWSEVSNLVKSGLAPEVFPVGSILHTKWVDTRTGNTTEWDYLLRVVSHENIDTRDDTDVPAMTLQTVYALPFATQFDAYEAFYAVPAGGLEAGTYHVSFEGAIGKIEAGELDWEFTLTQDLSEGAQLCFSASIYSAKPTNVVSYASASATTATETVSCTAGDDGTSLGTIATTIANFDPTGNLNIAGRIGYGNNRWAHSGLRQHLNKDGAASAWWAPANKWDRPPTYLSTTTGHLAGFSEDFVSHLAERKVVTALPYCDGGTSGGTEADTTYDKVFLPAMEQLYWANTGYGVPDGLEGDPWPYWREANGSENKASMGSTHTEYCLCSYDAKTTRRNVFERSAYRSNTGSVTCCGASGFLSTSSANSGNYAAPAYSII